jgi:glycosyltransferase involved in cell wall biosynthesis
MRILQVHNFYDHFGGECQVVRAQRALLEAAGHEVVPFYRHSRDIAGWSALRKANALARVAFNPEMRRRLAETVASARPDVAHVHNVFPLISPSIYTYLAELGIPIVQTVHNYRFVCPNGLFYAAGKPCEACLQEKSFLPALRKACFRDSWALSGLYAAAVGLGWRNGAFAAIDTFVALSYFIRDKLTQGGVSLEKIRVCGNFIDLGRAEPAHFPKSSYALYLGRLSAEKGIRTLLAALRRCRVPCKIAGDGPLRAEVIEALQDPALAHVDYLGFVDGDAKRELIARAACTVVPSECYENFPMAGVESLSLGTAVVAARIGGLPELVQDGETGFLFDAGDAGALAAALMQVAESPDRSAQMGQQAAHEARMRFGAARHLSELLAIYHDTLGQKRDRAAEPARARRVAAG